MSCYVPPFGFSLIAAGIQMIARWFSHLYIFFVSTFISTFHKTITIFFFIVLPPLFQLFNETFWVLCPFVPTPSSNFDTWFYIFFYKPPTFYRDFSRPQISTFSTHRPHLRWFYLKNKRTNKQKKSFQFFYFCFNCFAFSLGFLVLKMFSVCREGENQELSEGNGQRRAKTCAKNK